MSSSIGTICFSFIAWCTRFTDNVFDETDIAKRWTTTPANQDLFHWLRLTDSKSPGACLITEQPSPYRRRVVLGEPSRNRWSHANARARACEPKAYALLAKANFSANYRTSQITFIEPISRFENPWLRFIKPRWNKSVFVDVRGGCPIRRLCGRLSRKDRNSLDIPFYELDTLNLWVWRLFAVD